MLLPFKRFWVTAALNTTMIYVHADNTHIEQARRQRDVWKASQLHAIARRRRCPVPIELDLRQCADLRGSESVANWWHHLPPSERGAR